MTKVAIITLNYNGKKDTLEFLKSLNKLPTTNYQPLTIVVDNASSDGSVTAIKKQFPKVDPDSIGVDILQTAQNLGFGGGFNKGIEYATIWGADYFLIINNDCLIKDGNLLEELIKTAKSDGKIGLVSPKIYFAAGFEFHKDRYSKSEQGKVIWYAGGRFDWDNIGSIHRGLDQVDEGKYDVIEQSEIFSGACVLVKKEVFNSVGLFNEDYFLYFEEAEFAKRATDAGFKIYYNGRVSVYHKVSRSAGIGSEITDYYHTRNRLIFGFKYGRLRTKAALIREALKRLIFGRSAQRRGILDFYLGEKGAAKFINSSESCAKYPLKLSIGIVNYNTADLTKRLLQSIFTGNPGVRSYLTPGVGNVRTPGFDPKSMEVIVLDNGDIDPCKDQINEFLLALPSGGPKIKYLKNQENEGFSKGYNKTIKYSLGEYYLMLNSDIEVLDNGLKEMLKWAENFKGEAVLGGKLVFPDGSDQDSAFHLPTVSGAFKEYFLAKKGEYFMFEPKGDKPSSVEGMVMACFLIPKKILQRIGLLDEGTFIFFEDIEYAQRLRQNNIPLYFIPSAKFIHHHGASTKRLGQEKAYELLKKSARHFHGSIYYFLLSWVLRIGQKFGRVKTPVSRWTIENS